MYSYKVFSASVIVGALILITGCPTSTSPSFMIYKDLDGDGFGNSLWAVSLPGDYSVPSGWVANYYDCADDDADQYPNSPQNACPDPFPGPVGYTKIDANGNDLPEGDNSPWDCVRDNRTGLIWEAKTNDGGLRDTKWRYTWCNTDPATNGGEHGPCDTGNLTTTGWQAGGSSFGSDACFDHARCDTEKYAADVNATMLCGRDGWRMPYIGELLTLTKSYPLLWDHTYFPRTNPFYYFTNSLFPTVESGAWMVDFAHANEHYGVKTYPAHIRLVHPAE